jgi:phage-related minor tail protein
MHFLTLAQYEHIAALQQTGREQEAQTALARALDDHMKTVSEPTLGTIQLAWKGVAMAVHDAGCHERMGPRKWEC